MNLPLLQAITSLGTLLHHPLSLHLPSALDDLANGRIRLPGISQETATPIRAGIDLTDTEDAPLHPNEYRAYPELGIGIQPVNGVILAGASPDREAWSGYFNTNRIVASAAAFAADPSLHTYILALDTPGGSCYGLSTASDAIMAIGKMKKGARCLAYAPRLCASAGMHLAASCDSIHTAPSAIIGSIGVIASLSDSTGFWDKLGMKSELFTDGTLKALGHARHGITAEQRAWMQSEVDTLSAAFKGLMRQRRIGITDATMQGQIFESRRAPATLRDTATCLTLNDFIRSTLTARI